MRSSPLCKLFLGLVVASGAGACAKPDQVALCHPVSSWSSPVFACSVAAPPAPAPLPPPPPEPVAAPAPPPPPPPKAVMKDDKIELTETIEFETDSDKLLPSSEKILDEVVVIMKEHTDIKKIRVEGYTDSTATKEHNLKLSQQRADAVKAYLTGHGIEEKRLKTKGLGQTNPVGDNKTEEGRHQNRRVDFKILKEN